MSERRLIGIDLAWSARNGSGCVELGWKGGGLALERMDLLWSDGEIVEWIGPERGDWIVAVDAPLVVLNETGRRAADAEASARYRKYEAGAYPTNLKLLGADHRGGRLLRALEECECELVEEAGGIGGRRLAFETYPHVAMVELFGLERTIKYKKGRVKQRRAGQQELADAIRRHLCAERAEPRLLLGDELDGLLRAPNPELKGKALKRREDLLDGLVCAYASAWADAGRPLQGLGEIGAGVMIAPMLRAAAARLF